VLYARYGAFQGWADVTDLIRWLVMQAQDSQRRLVTKRVSLEDLCIPEPSFGHYKSLVIVYRHRGGVRLSITGDWDTATIPPLPGPLSTAPGRPAPGQELIVLYAGYGNQGIYSDGTANAQAAVKGAALTVHPDQLGLGDPFFGRHKAFIIVYREGGKVRMSVTPEGVTARLGETAIKP
jgi:hypothetical protein